MTEHDAAEPISHRTPTEATIKQLYGTAFRCGKPGCGRPLYTMDNETGGFVLNSHVAHIAARSEGGPRWDPSMSEADNRGVENLIPLCMEHAYAIDTNPDQYPVKLLLEWKRAQIADHLQVQKGWSLTDEEAHDVVEASFKLPSFGLALASASAMTATARAVGMFAQSARQERDRTRNAAAAWNAMREQFQARAVRGWDGETGEMLPPPEPPLIQVQPYRTALVASMAQAVENLGPLHSALVAEVHAARAVAPEVEPWCRWLEAAAEGVIAALGRWPGNPPRADDQILADALTELDRASTALSSAWSGRPGEQPPVPAPAEAAKEETEAERREREHRDVVDRARPWGRVQTRAYDPDLYMALVSTARYAVDLPVQLTNISVDLAATAGLAAAVARNADDATYAELIETSSRQLPLAVGVELARALMFVAEKGQRAILQTQAKEVIIKLLTNADWGDPTVWRDNRYHARKLLHGTASLTSEVDVRSRLAAAFRSNPELLEPMLIGMSEHIERRDIDDMSRVLGIDTRISSLPEWFPTSELAAEINRRFPDLRPANPDAFQIYSDELRGLAAHLLEIAGRSEY